MYTDPSIFWLRKLRYAQNLVLDLQSATTQLRSRLEYALLSSSCEAEPNEVGNLSKLLTAVGGVSAFVPEIIYINIIIKYFTVVSITLYGCLADWISKLAGHLCFVQTHRSSSANDGPYCCSYFLSKIIIIITIILYDLPLWTLDGGRRGAVRMHHCSPSLINQLLSSWSVQTSDFLFYLLL